MKDPLRPGLQPVSQLKTGPTTSSTQPGTLLSPGQPPLIRPSSRLRVQRASSREETYDSASEKATLDLIRRVLYPQTSSGHGASSPQPAEELLPPLTSSNDVDHQLYAILAVIMKDFVYSWYSKITPDQALVNEVLQVVAHCTRALEQRIRRIDITQLILDEIPALVETHISSYRLSKERSSLSGLPTSRRALYHELNPHPGLVPIPDPADPETITAQTENEAMYRRLLASGTLAVLLPTEDLGNSSLRHLVGDIISDLILGKQVAGRVCQSWFLWETIGKAAEAGQRRGASNGANAPTDAAASQLDRFGLLQDDDPSSITDNSRQSHATVWLWAILQNLYLGYLGLRFLVTGLFRVASGSKKAVSRGCSVSGPTATSDTLMPPNPKASPFEGATTKIPVLNYRLYSMISQLLGISHRLPWLSGTLALAQHMILAGPGKLGQADGTLDRFLRETIETYLLPPTLLPNLLIATRSALVPAKARSVAPTVTGGTGAASLSASQPASQAQALASGGQVAPVTVATAGIPTSAAERSQGGGPVGRKILSDSTLSIESNDELGTGQIRPDGDSALGKAVEAYRSPAPVPGITLDAHSPGQSSPENTPKQMNHDGPSTAEIAAIKRRCATSLLAVIPRSVARKLFGVVLSPQDDRTYSNKSSEGNTESLSSFNAGDSSSSATPDEESEEAHLLHAIEEDFLDLMSDEYCNKHLVYSIVETVLARILPELTERSVAEIMEDRGVTFVPGTSEA